MKKRYISVDVETTGSPSPEKYSMISLGACVVGDTNKQFYKEIKPINGNFQIDAMKIVVPGIKCFQDYLPSEELNPSGDKFDPRVCLEILSHKGEGPRKVMEDFANWIFKVTEGYKPVEVASPIKFDGSFTSFYFSRFYSDENPFKWNGEDINSMYRGAVGNENAHIAQLGFREKGLPHNSLEDAIIQAREMEKVLEIMRSKRN